MRTTTLRPSYRLNSLPARVIPVKVFSGIPPCISKPAGTPSGAVWQPLAAREKAKASIAAKKEFWKRMESTYFQEGWTQRAERRKPFSLVNCMNIHAIGHRRQDPEPGHFLQGL